MRMKDPHKILGLRSSATKEDIKKAYRQLAQKYHPDSGSKADAKHFAQLTEAYHLLKDFESESEKAVEAPSIHQNLYKQRIDPSRKKQQKAFYKNKRRQAILRVLGLSILLGGLFYFVAWLGAFYKVIAGVLGVFLGLMFGLRRFFDLGSFLNPKLLKRFNFFYWVGMGLGVLFLFFLTLSLF